MLLAGAYPKGWPQLFGGLENPDFVGAAAVQETLYKADLSNS
jgi:hypothetical protein